MSEFSYDLRNTYCLSPNKINWKKALTIDLYHIEKQDRFDTLLRKDWLIIRLNEPDESLVPIQMVLEGDLQIELMEINYFLTVFNIFFNKTDKETKEKHYKYVLEKVPHVRALSKEGELIDSLENSEKEFIYSTCKCTSFKIFLKDGLLELENCESPSNAKKIIRENKDHFELTEDFDPEDHSFHNKMLGFYLYIQDQIEIEDLKRIIPENDY